MSLTLVPHTRTVTPVSRADLDARLARILADAVVAEMRRELQATPHAPAALEDDLLDREPDAA
jgi:hypothetical protein